MESRIGEALQCLNDVSGAKVASVARAFGVPRNRLRYRLEGRQPKAGRPAANLKLSRPEEAALCRYIDRLDHMNLAVRPEFVTDAANNILRERSGQADFVIGSKWTSRFLKRHGYFKKLQKKLHAERQAAEDLVRVTQYFQSLEKVVQEQGIPPEDIWNMDETGFRIGVGKDQLIVTKRKRAHYLGIPENRESATDIEAISAGGACIPPFLILSGQMHMSSWYHIAGLDSDTAIRPTPTGYSNDEISLEWLKHFDLHSAKSSKSSKRLLILDGHGSHHTRQFIQYCDEHGIIPFGMPPNLTHVLQPLDVVVFQPLKHYHAKALDVMIRDGLVSITKIEFLSCIQQVRLQAFKSTTIQSAFRKTGIWPFNPHVVLEVLQALQVHRTPSPRLHPGPSSSPFETPLTLRQINKVADRLETSLRDDDGLNTDLRRDLGRFIRGSLSLATELVQTKRDLGRTKMAERVRQQRRSLKNAQIQSGGVLTVAQGREMVRKRDEEEVNRARKVMEAAEMKAHSMRRRCFENAAKKARKWRSSGKLSRAEVCDSERGTRWLKRF